MKAHITTDGNLMIMRKDKYTPQSCPFAKFEESCGDHCPLFGEPEDLESEKGMATLKICKTEFNFTEFKDYRTLAE